MVIILHQVASVVKSLSGSCLFLQEDGNNNIAASNHSMDDSLLATAVDGDSDDEQLFSQWES